jgi:hypothetical protein
VARGVESLELRCHAVRNFQILYSSSSQLTHPGHKPDAERATSICTISAVLKAVLFDPVAQSVGEGFGAKPASGGGDGATNRLVGTLVTQNLTLTLAGGARSLALFT